MRCTACSFLLDRLEYALHLLGQVLGADRAEGREQSASFLEHELAHLHLVVETAKAVEIVPNPRPPPRLGLGGFAGVGGDDGGVP
jgi:hypothetical protein